MSEQNKTTESAGIKPKEMPYIQDINSNYKIHNANDLINPEYNGHIVVITPKTQEYTFDYSMDSRDPVAIAFNEAKRTLIEDKAPKSEIIQKFIKNNNPTKGDRIEYEKELATITSEVFANIDVEGRGKIFAEYRTDITIKYNIYDAKTEEYRALEIEDFPKTDFIGPPTAFPVHEISHFNDIITTSNFACSKMAPNEAMLLQLVENKILPKQPDDYSEKANYQYATNYHVMSGRMDYNIADGIVSISHTYIISEATASIIEATLRNDGHHLNYKTQIDPNYTFADAVAGNPSIVKNINEKYQIYGNIVDFPELIAERKASYIKAKEDSDNFSKLNDQTFSHRENLFFNLEQADKELEAKANLIIAAHKAEKILPKEQGITTTIISVKDLGELPTQQNNNVEKPAEITIQQK